MTDYEQASAFDRDGYLVVPGVFSPEEVRIMLNEVEGGGIASRQINMPDASGKSAKLAIWYELADDVWGAASTHPKLVNTLRILLREEICFFHGKVMMKEAHSGGAWEWHQDYGYWYNEGFLYPNMLSAFVALDPATIANGCLQVLRGSHRLGRLDHGRVGNQTGGDPSRIGLLEERLERVPVELEAGSVVFFHCNTLHTSAPNESDNHRRSFIVCYTAQSNPQMRHEGGVITREYCPTGPADGLLRFSV